MNFLKIKTNLLVICFLCLCGAVSGQSITLKLDQVPMKEAMETLKKNYTYSFVFETGDVDTQKIITIALKNVSIEEAVQQIIQGQNLSYEIKGKNIILRRSTGPSSANKKDGVPVTISGFVENTHGEPVVGAAIIEETTSRGTVSGANGSFMLKMVTGAKLTITCMGYIAQEIVISSQSKLRIILQEDTQLLDDVVVVGYGVQKKENLTGAVVSLDGKALENRPVSNISQALQGTIGNLNISPNSGNSSSDWDSSGGAPGASQNINIRGYTGFDTNGNALAEAPLVVIDGVQGGDLNTINMSDVASITVLKDAASSAIYGSSAPFGVILITTKKGNIGQKATITYNNNFMFSQPISLPKMMNSLDYAMAFNQFSSNANTASLYNAGTLSRIVEYMNGTRRDETMADGNVDTWLSAFGSNANNDWFDIHFKDVSFSHQHNLGITGGTKNTTYYVGLGYVNQEGMYTYGNDSFKRYNARTTLQTNIFEWLSVGFRGTFSRGEKDNPNSATFANSSILHILAQRRPTQALQNPDGNYSNGSYVPAFRDGGRVKTTTDNATLVGEVILHPTKGWDITANYAFSGAYGNRISHLKTVFHTLPSGKQSILNGTTPNALSRRMDRNERHLVNVFTSYEKTVSNNYFKVMVGYMQEMYDKLYLSGANNELYSDNILSLATTYGTKISASDLNEQIATRGVFGRINYNYKERYLLELNGRYDGTSRFLKPVRFKFYPGVSAAWVPSKEAFWEPIQKVVNMFKLRASYGSQGSQGSAGYYPFYPALQTSAPTSTSNNWLFNGGQQAMVQFPSGLIDPRLTWVTTNTIDFGVDLGLFANKLNISFDWYKRSAQDYQGPAQSLPALLGTAAPLTNNAAMATTGFELNVGWRHKIGKVNYSVDVVLSDYSSTITKYPNPTRMTISGLGSVYNPLWYEGRQFGEIWGFETVGLFQSQAEIDRAPDQSQINAKPWTVGDVRYADLDGDGKITWGDNTVDNPGDRKIIGNSTPRYSFGITLAADWKGLDFMIFIQGVGKRDSPANHYSGEYRYANFVWGVPRQGSYAQATMWQDQQNRWSEYNTPSENAKALFPKMYFSDENMKNTHEQTRYLQNAAYARLKTVQVGYSLPAHWINKIALQKLRVFVSVENLGTWTKMISTLDPEFSSSDGKIYPLQRVWAVGLSATF